MSLVSGIQYSTEITGRRNAIINGNFDIWQRGTSQTTLLYGSADRWGMYKAGTSVTQTMSRQAFTTGQVEVPNNPTYYVRHVVAVGTDVATQARMFQGIEDVRTFAGETVTISFWAKTSVPLDIALMAYQGFGTGGSPSAELNTALDKVSCTTSWQKYSVTAVIPSISGKTLGSNGDSQLSINFWFSVGSNNATDASNIGLQAGTFELAQIQIEKGDTATDFERRPIGEEYNLCYRYYWRRVADESTNARLAVGGNIISITGTQIGVPLPVPMRATPTLSHGTLANMQIYDGSVTNTVTAISAAEASREIFNLAVTTTGSTLTAFRVGQLTRNASASDVWIAFDAEI